MSALDTFASDSSEKFKELLGPKTFLIVDSSPRVLEYLYSLLFSMGIPKEQIFPALNYASASKLIQEKKPDVILCEYDLEEKCGMELLTVQKENPSESLLHFFILVTSNTSQIAVARAAEEDVDAYVLKPFTGGVLRDTILKAAASKLSPNPYEKTLEQGKILLAEKKYDEAHAALEKARTLHVHPSLALYYLGQLEQERKNFKLAQEHYLSGLRHNRIHQKCMSGLYHVLVEQNLHADAYAVLKRMLHYFPADPDRLSVMLRLAIVTRNYEDVEKVYRIFSEMEKRDEELIKYICAALVVCGKFYLQKNFRSRAIELFQNAVKTAAGNLKIIKEAFFALIDAGLEKEAEEYFRLCPKNSKASPEYQIMAYVVANKSLEASAMINLGQELIKKGLSDPNLYEILIKRILQSESKSNAVALATEASEKWPEMKHRFQRLLN